jgi:excisionase family DNA binding protein
MSPLYEGLLRVDEVARILRLSRGAVYSLLAKGMLTYVNVATGRRKVPRIHAHDLDAFLNARAVYPKENSV